MIRARTGLVLLVAVMLLVPLFFAIRFVRAMNLLGSIDEVETSCRAIETVPGPEDIVIDRARGFAFVSATDRRALRSGGEASARVQGGIHRIDLNEPRSRWRLVSVTPPSLDNFRPHGLGLLAKASGERSLFVVNHPFDAPDEVIILDVDPQGRLSHRRTVTDPLLVDLNDVQPVGDDAFYATNDHGASPSTMLQDLLLLDRANVVYFDGSQARIVADGLTYANGVNASPDGREIYVAETTDRALRIYDRDPETGGLTLAEVVELETGGDNIDVLASGDLLIGSHPKLLDFAAHAGDPSVLSPSQVVRVSRKAAGGWSVRTLYLDRGDEISGVAVAAGYDGKMLLGPVFQSQILVCSQDASS